MRYFALFLLLLSGQAWAAETYYVRSASACPNNGDGTAYSCAASGGAAGAWSGVGNISFGATGSTFGRGDTLHICDTHSTAITIGSVGAFDGNANTAGDIVNVDGDAAFCGGTQGGFADITGNAINMSGSIAWHVSKLSFDRITGSAVQVLYGATNNCTASTDPYYCTYFHDLTCSYVGTTAGSCAAVMAQGNTAYPSSTVAGKILLADITDDHGGGAACRIRLNSSAAVERRCTSTNGGGATVNVWPVYASGVFMNCGPGVGNTWTNVSGTLYKLSQTACLTPATTGATLIDLFVTNKSAGVPGRLAIEAGCVTNEANCISTVGSGEWGQLGDVIYVNVGKALSGVVNFKYADNANTLITEPYVTDPSAAFDGIGAGCDSGTTACTVEKGYVSNAPLYGYTCGSEAYSCTIRGSISRNAGTAGARNETDGAIYNVSTSGSSLAASVRTNSGSTVIVKNVGGSGLSSAVTDDLGEGTLTVGTNSTADPGYVGGAAPANADGFCLKSDSTLIDAGTYIGAYIGGYNGESLTNPPPVGARGLCQPRRVAAARRVAW